MIRNILIKSVNWIGDAVRIIPAISLLKNGFPSSKIVVIANKWVKDVFETSPFIDEIIVYPDRLLERIALLREIRKRRFDLGVTFQPRSYSSALFLYFSKITLRIGYGFHLRKLFLNYWIDLPKKPIHDQDLFLNLIRSLDIRKKEDKYFLSIDNESILWSKRFLKEHNIKDSDLIIGLNPGGYSPLKRWSVERFSFLADRLINKYNAKIIVFGAEGDIKILERIKNLCKNKVYTIVSSLEEYAALVKRCRLLITNDTGPMHIADALEVPVIVLFGPTDPKRSSPLGKNSKIIKKEIACSPCKKKSCKSHLCMDMISVEEVEKEVIQMIRITEIKMQNEKSKN